MYARTVEAYGSDKGMPRAQGGQGGAQGASKTAGNSLSNGSSISASASADWSPVSLPMLKRIYGDGVSVESMVSAGKGGGKGGGK